MVAERPTRCARDSVTTWRLFPNEAMTGEGPAYASPFHCHLTVPVAPSIAISAPLLLPPA